jgi:hypothetical protein
VLERLHLLEEFENVEQRRKEMEDVVSAALSLLLLKREEEL